MDEMLRENKIMIVKRNNRLVPFDADKIVRAVKKANNSDGIAEVDKMTDAQIYAVADRVAKKALTSDEPLTVEKIQDSVERGIMEMRAYEVAQAYVRFRYNREMAREMKKRDDKLFAIIDNTDEEIKGENSNKNARINSTQRDYMAGEVSKDLTNRVLLPPEVVKAHQEGIIHFHDADYFAQREHNCDLINLEDMLQNGTVISGTKIDKPKSFYTACNITTQIVAQVASNQYGGQTFTLSHLAPFVDVSRRKIRAKVEARAKKNGIEMTQEQIASDTEDILKDEIKDGVQTIQYQLITLMTTNGQTPFVTMFMYLDEVPEGQTRDDLAMIIEEVLKQRIQGVKDEKGAWITPAFPKIIFALDEDNVPEDSKYHYLYDLSAKCTAKRMVPDYISVKKMKELKGDVYPCMGCRSFLTPESERLENAGNIANALNYVPGRHRYYGRFNQGVVTLNLPDIALSAVKEANETGRDKFEAFWSIMNDRLDLCHTALRCRHERLLGTPSDVAPILWQHGALARLQPGETIDKLLFNGYSTISLGYAGLAETVYEMLGISHTSKEGEKFGLEVMQAMNDACAKWKAAENIDYSVYGTPLESTTYKFAKCLRKRFGTIKNVTDHGYITNSYHICVREEIDAFSKLTKEAEFQKLSPGGAISYVEIPDMSQNLPAEKAIIHHIYDTILYAELNTKSDHCDVCGYEGEIQIVTEEHTDENGEKHQKLVWECPNCGCRDQSKMHVARRTCGYIGSQYWNPGRTEEIRDRVVHVATDADFSATA